MRILPFVLLAAALTGCAKASGPLKLYFLSSTRFTSGNRTAAPADTLAARLYADNTSASSPGITRLRVTVDYSPRHRPFVYPTPLSSFLISSVTPNAEQVVYLDSTFTTPPKELLYTNVFGVRTSTGTERWTYEVTDQAGETAVRTFIVNQRRSDSTTVYNEYVLRLNLPVRGATTRRFIDLQSGLALPAHTVAKTGAVLAQNLDATTELQNRTDLILARDGSLVSPNKASLNSNWKGRKNATSFALTTLTATTFDNVTDTLALHNRFTGTVLSSLSGLATGQVYAVRLHGDTGYSIYGLMLVVNTTSGYQLRLRVAKRPL